MRGFIASPLHVARLSPRNDVCTDRGYYEEPYVAARSARRSTSRSSCWSAHFLGPRRLRPPPILRRRPRSISTAMPARFTRGTAIRWGCCSRMPAPGPSRPSRPLDPRCGSAAFSCHSHYRATVERESPVDRWQRCRLDPVGLPRGCCLVSPDDPICGMAVSVGVLARAPWGMRRRRLPGEPDWSRRPR